ncbi:hypothetical protein D3C73_1004560 [compost metagenome]
MPHQADHLARLDGQVQPPDNLAVAIAKAHVAQFNAAIDVRQRGGLLRLGHAGHMVQHIENALGAGGRFLRDRDDAAHRIQAHVKAPDIRKERRQHAHRDLVLRHLPNTEYPHHQQTHFGQQRHRGRKQGPRCVHAVVDFQVAVIGFAKPRDLALFLRKRLDHANTGNRVGQHVGDLGPDAVDLFKAMAQAVAHRVDHPDDERQRHQRDQRQPGVDRHQDHRRHDNHQDVGGEVQQMQRQEHANTVGLAANAGDQVARALAAKIFQRQLLQVLIRGGAQVGADTFADPGQDVGPGPAQPPCQQGGRQQTA